MPDMALDPARGFVALPLDLFDFDLTPGAFRTLVEFCRMANAEGQCWPSLAQLSERLGRSRAAISGYISELRAAGLVTTETQRTANGFNYRLRYCLPFWARWKARFGKSSAQKAECRVQPAERNKDKNQIPENQSPQGGMNSAKKLLAQWTHAVGQEQYPRFAQAPSPELVDESRREALKTQRSAQAGDIQRAFADHKVTVSADEAADFEPLCKYHSPDELRAILKESWKPHWRKAPSPAQFAALLETQPAAGAVAQLLHSYLRRAERAGYGLRDRPKARDAGSNPAGPAPSYPRI